MKQRIITAIIILAVTIPVVLLSEYPIYPLALSLLSFAASFEMLRVLGAHKKKSVFIPTCAMSLLLPFFTHDIFLGVEAKYATDYILICFCVIFVYLLYLMGAAVFSHGELTNGYHVRRAAVDYNIPLITNARLATAFIRAFCAMSIDDIQIKSWDQY